MRGYMRVPTQEEIDHIIGWDEAPQGALEYKPDPLHSLFHALQFLCGASPEAVRLEHSLWLCHDDGAERVIMLVYIGDVLLGFPGIQLELSESDACAVLCRIALFLWEHPNDWREFT